MRLTRIIFALLLLTIGGLITGCEAVSPMPTPPPSQYPADIIGRVTIAKTVLELDSPGVKQEIQASPSDRVWWIVEVSVKNKEYTKPVSARWDSSMSIPINAVWGIIYNGTVWSVPHFESSQQGIQKGQSGTLWLSFEARTDFNPADLQIVYQGEKPFSYGKLISGDTVAVYDWELKKVTQATASTQQVILNTKLQTITLKDKTIPWEVVLKSAVWSGAKVSVTVSVANKGNQPADFPYDEFSGLKRVVNFVTIDSYGMSYLPDGYPIFNVEQIYPGETRTFKATFTLNSKSGKTALYVTWYTGGRKAHLFDLGAPK